MISEYIYIRIIPSVSQIMQKSDWLREFKMFMNLNDWVELNHHERRWSLVYSLHQKHWPRKYVLNRMDKFCSTKKKCPENFSRHSCARLSKGIYRHIERNRKLWSQPTDRVIPHSSPNAKSRGFRRGIQNWMHGIWVSSKGMWAYSHRWHWLGRYLTENYYSLDFQINS